MQRHLLNCNKRSKCSFFLHLIYGLDYYARARHIFHSCISFSSLLNSMLMPHLYYVCVQNVFILVKNSNIVENLGFGKKYIFRHEFRVFFAVYLTLSSLYKEKIWTKNQGKRFLYYDWHFTRKHKCYQCKLYLWYILQTDKKCCISNYNETWKMLWVDNNNLSTSDFCFAKKKSLWHYAEKDWFFGAISKGMWVTSWRSCR